MMIFIKKALSFAADLFFTVRCPFCEAAIYRTEIACEKCSSLLPKEPYLKYISDDLCCVSALTYDGKFKKAVHNLKFYGKGSYAKQLAPIIVEAVYNILPDNDFDIITCVPMHKSALYERRYNQAELLARHCARLMNIPYCDTLIKYKENMAQHNIKARDRVKNVKGVYKISEKQSVTGKQILLIDDVITTGSTLKECASILTAAGCSNVFCATLCTVRE